MHKCRIYETIPFLKEAPSFPLHAMYKKPYSVVRVEPDGSIFAYQSSHSMNVFLTLRYSQLYLNWGFIEEKDDLRLLEYNTELPYTGTIVCSDFGACSFENGRLIEKESPEVHTAPKLSADILSFFSKTDMEHFIHAFCSRLKRIEKEHQVYMENLSHFLHIQIPEKNNNLITDENDIEKLHNCVYFDNIYVEDEYETVSTIVIEIAEETYKNTAPEEDAFHFYDFFSKEERHAFRNRLHNTFSRSELNSIIKFWSDYAEANVASTVSDEQKIELLTLLNLAPTYSKPPQSPRIPHHPRSKRLRDYLDD